MKDKKITYIIICIFISLIGIFLVLALINYNRNSIEKKDNIYKNGNFYKIDSIHKAEKIDDKNRIIRSTSELHSIFPNYKNNNINFNNHNYALFELIIDPCREENVKPTGYSLEGQKLYIKIEYDAKCGVCAPEYEYYLLQVPKNITYIDINLINEARNNPECNRDIAYKPMIYLYPEQQTEVTVKLGNPEYLTTTYPKYNDGWKVLVDKDGTIKMNNREYYGLFWEGNNHQVSMKEDGFIVEGKDIEKFLEEKLKLLGLTDKETNEFIIYWLPQLKNNKYNYIRFETIEEINNYMPLTINPEPNTIIRILMDYKPLNKNINIKEQTLTKVERQGFTVVEWGGSLIK